MQIHDAMPSGPGLEVGDETPVDVIVDNVRPLFAPRMGGVAEIVAAAAGPTKPRELLGEGEIRAAFRAVMAEEPPLAMRRRHKLAPFAIAAGSVAGLVAGTAGLSAAAVLPPAANHVMAQVLRQVGIDVAPATSLSTAPAVTHTRTTHPQVHATKAPKTPKTTAPSSNNPAVAVVAIPRVTSPPTTHPAVNSTPQCEVMIIQNQVVLVQLPPRSSTSSAPVQIPDAFPVGPPGPCSSRQITALEKAAAGKGSGSTTTPVTTTGGGTGTGGTGTGGTGTGGTGTGGTGTGGTGTGGSTGGSGKGTNHGGGGTSTGKGTNHGGSGGGKGHNGSGGTGSGTGTTTPPTDPSGTSTAGTSTDTSSGTAPSGTSTDTSATGASTAGSSTAGSSTTETSTSTTTSSTPAN